MTAEKPIFVTQPNMPPLDEFIPYLERIWESRQLTNCGPMHQRLETSLANYLGVPHVALFNNGTNALLTSLQALGISGEVITTPYSFAATAHSLLWNKLTPVFADIESGSFNIDPDRIEAAITPNTSAIMPVHCYGDPCQVERIREIAAHHRLRVIYDAAHAFGVRYRSESLLRHGDLAVLSFHATKVFNTFEGGAIVCHDPATKARIDQLKNFGIVDEDRIEATGLNGKMNELQASFGLLQLLHLAPALSRRNAIDEAYRRALADIPGIRCIPPPANTERNCTYFPILVGTGARRDRDTLHMELRKRGIFARRYFYPLLSDLPMYAGFRVGLVRQSAERVAGCASGPVPADSRRADGRRRRPCRRRCPWLISGAIVKLAIMQPYFLPYFGYFQLIAAVDLFVLYDDIKYTKKGWINRNRMLQNGKAVTFSLPLKGDSDYLDVRERRLAENFDRDKLLNQFIGAYRHAPHFSRTITLLEQVMRYEDTNLFGFLHHSIARTCEHLGIATEIRVSSGVAVDRNLKGQDRVLAMCGELGASTYVNAIGGMGLYSGESFREKSVELKFVRSMPFEYPQFGDEFVPWLSIIDVMMFNPRETIAAVTSDSYDLV